jgi:hypothetical protein
MIARFVRWLLQKDYDQTQWNAALARVTAGTKPPRWITGYETADERFQVQR